MPRSLVKTAEYDELFDPVEIAALVDAPDDAIARVEPARAQRPAVPVDLGGVIDAETPAPEGRPGRSGPPQAWWSRPYRAPEIYAVALRRAACFGGQFRAVSAREHEGGQTVLAQGHFVVPDSFHVRDRARSLPRDLLTPVGESGTSWRLSADPSELPVREGLHVLAGSAFPHFGHF